MKLKLQLKTLIKQTLLFIPVVYIPNLLAEDRLSYKGGFNLIHQHSSEQQLETDTSLSADLAVFYKSENDGVWHLHIEASSTPNQNGVAAILQDSNADSGSSLNDRDHGRVQISELNYTHSLTENTQLSAGLVDATGYLDTAEIMNDENHHFISSSLVNNAVIDFPDYVIGAALQHQINDQLSTRLFISSTHGIADNNSRNYSSLFEVNDDEKGLFTAIEMSYKTETHYLNTGGWLHSGQHQALNNPNQTDLSNYGLYLGAGLKKQKHQYEMRFGLANPEVSAACQFLSLAYLYSTNSWDLGLGYSTTRLSEELQGDYPKKNETAELFLHKHLNKHWFITPSVQWFNDPLYESDSIELDSPILTYNIRLSFEF
ncbi:MAG: hypothetical protein U9R28_03340 [Pseudomonadota bacterium]|nr:hypothetical protein [Pseudomonadota bacterium]